MDYNLQIQKILIQIDAEVSMTNKANLLKQAINLADAHNDIAWGFDLRIDLMDTCSGVAKNIDALPAFVWLLETCSRNPDLFDEKDLLWKYKWMIDSAARNSKTAMEQINAIVDDFKIRLQNNDYGLRSYYSIKVSVGFITENPEMVKENLDQRNLCERDNMSDSPSHDLYDEILYYLMTNQIDAALALEKDLFKRDMGNPSNLFAINTCYAEFLARTGRLDLVQKYIDASEDNFALLQKECYLMVTISSLIYALTITDREKAWRYFEQYAHWIDEGEEYDTLIFALNLLPLLSQNEQRHLQLNARLPFYNTSGIYETKELFAYFYDIVNGLVQAFDVRNGNNSFSKQLDLIKFKD